MLIVDNQRLLEIEEKVKRILPYDECNVLLPDLHAAVSVHPKIIAVLSGICHVFS